MATIVVEVPDSIAKKFISYDIVPSLELYEELDDEVWTSVKVGEKASVVLDYLKKIK